MANLLINRILKSIGNSKLIGALSSRARHLSSAAIAEQPPSDGPSSLFTFSSDGKEDKSNRNAQDDSIYVKSPSSSSSKREAASSVTMPMSFMTGSIVGKVLQSSDYEAGRRREWVDCDARLPDAQNAIEEAPKASYVGSGKGHCDGMGIPDRQVEKMDPLLDWVKSEFGFKPAVYSSFFGGKQEDGLTKAIETLLKQTDDCELAAIDAIASSAHSLIIAIGIFRGKLQIEEAIELIRLEEEIQVDRWGLVEGGHDVDAADLRVHISSAAVFLGLSRS